MKTTMSFLYSKFLFNLALFSIGLLFLGCVGVSYRTTSQKVMENPPPVESVQRGAHLYSQFCSDCHGPNGRGNGPKSVELLNKPANLKAGSGHVTNFGILTIVDYPHYSSRTIETSIQRGRNSMPALDQKLNGQETQDVTNYIVDLIHKK